MGRRRLSLLERLLAGTFRPKHHRDLLATERLPRTPPPGVDRNLWRELRLVHADYEIAGSDAERREIARAFADLADRVASNKAESLGIHALLYGTIEAPVAAESVAEGFDADAELAAWSGATAPPGAFAMTSPIPTTSTSFPPTRRSPIRPASKRPRNALAEFWASRLASPS
jgi:hypothetical protein